MAYSSPRTSAGPDWFGASLAGAVTGVVVGLGLLAIDPAVVEEHVPEVVDASGAIVGLGVLAVVGVALGLVYATLAAIDPLGQYLVHPRLAPVVGLWYGLVVWLVAIILVPLLVGAGPEAIGEIAVTPRAAAAFLVLGLVLGVGYWSVARRRR